MGDNFLSKSFLFEIVDSNTENIEASFTLVLPPQQYSIKEKHRINITKTFGNAFIDDYGPDNLEMVIKGISGTAHAFPTFRTKGVSASYAPTSDMITASSRSATEGFRHKEAFYTFRDEIMRYRDRENFDQKELRVYDLADEQAYKAVLLEFDLDRTSDKPFHYPFTISLFIYARLGSKAASTPKPILISSSLLDSLNNLSESIASLQKRFQIFNNIQTIRNQVALASNQLQLLRARVNSSLLQVRTVIESPLLLTRQLLDTMTTLAGFVYDAYVQGKLTIDSYVSATETIDNQMRDVLGVYGYSIQEGAQQTKTEIIEEYKGMDYSNPDIPVPTSDMKTFVINGVNLYTVKGEDTLQSIALKELGDETLWPYIASINPSIQSNSDLVVGEEIYVPVNQNIQTTTSKDNFILTEDTLRDPYGADIRLDSNGNIIVQESNDVSLVSGVDNVLQSIDVRLKTEIGSMIKQTAFGLMSQPGMAGTSQAFSYVRMSIQNTLIQDPRIASVKNVGVQIERDALHVSADIYLVGRETSMPVDVLVP